MTDHLSWVSQIGRFPAASGVGVWEWDYENGLVQWDDSVKSMMGVQGDAPVDMNVFEHLVHPDDLLMVREQFTRILTGDAMVHGMDYRVLHKDGQVRHLMDRGQVVRDAHGNVLRIMGMTIDVTQQRLGEQALRERDAAERASRAKSEFLSRVSHELRTPLNGILGFAQMLDTDPQEPLSPVQQQRVQAILHSGRRLLSIINDVLEVSRIERGGLTLQRESLQLKTLLFRALEIVLPLADSRGVMVRLGNVPDRLFVHVDARAFDQIALNLLSNAVKYTREGGEVTVEVEPASRSGRTRITVIDTGMGMDDAQLANLFQPFNRLGAERYAIEGTGLGLVITKELVQAMDGSLMVSSQPGVGSRFSVELPMARPTLDPHAPEAEALVQSDWISDLGAVALYVEDDPVNRVLMTQVFAGLSQWRLVVASTGEEALTCIRQEQPDLILTDMNLPDHSGVAWLQLLRSDPMTKSVPVVAVSADALASQIDAARAAGVTDYWTKPLDLKTVRAKLQAMLSGRDT